MRERSGTCVGVVVSVVLTVLIGVDPVHVQTTSTAAVAVTFPDTAGTLQLPGHLYRPDGPGPFPAVVGLHGCLPPALRSPNCRAHCLWRCGLRRGGEVLRRLCENALDNGFVRADATSPDCHPVP
jgi:hypothetical protein